MKNCRPDCQCPKCDPEMAAIMKMTPQQYAGWLTLNSAKTRRALGMAVAAAAQPAANDPYAAPDAYAAGVAVLRAANAAAEVVFRAGSNANAPDQRITANDYTPADPYAAGVAAMRSAL